MLYLDLLRDLKRCEHLISRKVKVISHNTSADRYCCSYWNESFLPAWPSQSVSSLDVLTNKVFYSPLLDAGLGPNFSFRLLPEGIKSDHADTSEVPLGLLCHTWQQHNGAALLSGSCAWEIYFRIIIETATELRL